MISQELQKKIDRAIRLLRQFDNPNEPIELSYSGGKDSDVILQLAKEAGIHYRAIYKSTTIDPPGTINHAIENGAEVIRPQKTFFQLIEQNGMPSRFSRFCCGYLKEYKVMDKAIIGVRRAESLKRKNRYKEPTACRIFKNIGGKKQHVEQIYPILDFTDDDVLQFIIDRNIRLHPLYYREDGTIDVSRRLGCLACPLMSKNKRIEEFKKHPKLVRTYIRAINKFFETHPDSKQYKYFNGNACKKFYADVFCDTLQEYREQTSGMFGIPDVKAFLEEYFKVKL